MYTAYSIAQLEAIVPNSQVSGISSATFDRIITDSRRVAAGNRTCFIALRGARQDGHQFIGAAYTAGVRTFIVENLPRNAAQTYPEAGWLITPDSRAALQALAKHHRKQFTLPVIGITGSNGKTIVKEWLGQLLAPDYRVVRNPRSYNSQIGVPLSVLNISTTDTLGIFEAGISLPGEMQKLNDIIRPSIGVFTHFGAAHRENFRSDDERAREKCQLFDSCEAVVYPAGQAAIKKALIETQFRGRHFTWGRPDDGADLTIEELTDDRIRFEFNGQSFTSPLPFNDRASRSNTYTCIATLCLLDVPPEEITKRIGSLRSPEMRLERMQGLYGSTLISDVWNNDLQALELALESLSDVRNTRKNVVILSDIEQSGVSADQLYTEVNRLLELHQVDHLLAVGPRLYEHRSLFTMEAAFHASTEVLLGALSERMLTSAAVLVKGGAAFRFDRIVHRLQSLAHPSVLEINMSRMVENLNFYRSRIRPDVKIMAMVKAFGYGTGARELAAELEFNRVAMLGVAYVNEGVQLRLHGVQTRIFVLNPDVLAMPLLIEHRLEPEIYSMRILDALSEELGARQTQEPYPVHLKIDTGMHRLGFQPDRLDALIAALQAQPLIKVAAVLSHLAAADDPQHDDFTRQQITRFTAACERLERELGYSFDRHLCNTAGLLRFPEAQFEMVRLGIGLYGVPSCDEDFSQVLPVSSLKTRISQLRHVAAGESVGYGRSGISTEPRVIATIPVGYADGYPRHLSDRKGEALVGGKRVWVTGKVCMDMTMLDVTHIDCNEGDEVVLFGDAPTLHEVAGAAGTIPYELIAGISQRVHRVYLYE